MAPQHHLPPFPATLPEVDLAYSQAVLMHMHTAGNHLEGLVNMFRQAQRYVVLMENWRCHEFMPDIQQLHASGRIDWPEIHFHYRESPDLQKPHLMVVARHSVPDYPRLDDYRLLSQNVK